MIFMGFKKYLKPLLLFLIYEIFWFSVASVIRSFFPATFAFSLSPFIPTESIIIELLMIFTIIIPFGGLLGYIMGGYILAPFFLYIHKKVFGSKFVYAIQEKPEVRSINIFYKSFFPILLSINITFMMLSPEVMQVILSSEFLSIITSLSIESIQKIVSLFILLPISFTITMFLFSSIWFLKNSGILYSNEKKVESISEPFVIRSVGGWFHTLLKGYAGIGVLITYFLVIIDLIRSFLITINTIFLVISLLLWFLVLIMLLLATIPSLILNEIIRIKSGNYVRRFGERLGIKERVRVQFNMAFEYENKTEKDNLN